MLHISYEDPIAAFQIKNVNLDYAEKASPAEKRALVNALDKLTTKDMTEVAVALEAAVEEDLKDFLVTLEASVTTEITRILIGGVFGRRAELPSTREAIAWIEGFDATDLAGVKFEDFEILLRFRDGREIDGRSFPNKQSAIQFLEQFVA